MPVPDIVIVEGESISPAVLKTLVERFFEDMVKYVVDVERGVAAVGGSRVRSVTYRLIGRGEPLA